MRAVALVALAAIAASLPSVASGEPPGPPLLHAAPPRAPQLENVAPFRARPILVSGAESYRRGEFLYQDFLYDDRGAAGTTDPAALATLASFRPWQGTLTYPTDPTFANNAADLVELRVKPLAEATALRMTVNSLVNPQHLAFTVAIGGSPEPRAWPHGAGVRSPAALFLTVHGNAAELRDAGTGAVVSPAPTAAVDAKRRQVTVRVPDAAWDPGATTVRMAAGVGLWDPAAGAYLTPGDSATPTTPGGRSSSGAALFNLAFRGDEPALPGRATGNNVVESSAVAPGAWRESAQAAALADGDISRFRAQVDFAKLRAGTRDDSAVPRTGPINRILSSREEYHQGLDPDEQCGRFPAECRGAFGGRLQPYTVYVPDRPVPPRGFGLTLLLHALLDNHNAYVNTRYQQQLGERGTGYLVVTPSARGPDGDYTDAAEANAFETWADVTRHYRLDPGRTTLSGYSMGGGGVYRLLTRWPDLFARGAAVGAATLEEQTGFLGSLRNIPILTWVGTLDEGTTPNLQQQAIADLERLGVEFRFATFPTADHLTIPQNDEFGPFADFLGDHRARRDAPHVTLGVVPRNDFSAAGVVADHAYWASGLRARGESIATFDARSEGFGRADPVPGVPQTGQGVVEAGNVGPLAYVERSVGHSRAEVAPTRDRLTITTRELAAATIHTRRARLSCAPRIVLDADGPLALRLVCPPKRQTCARTVALRLPRGGRIVGAVVRAGRRRVLLRARGKNLRKVVTARPTRRAFRLVVRLRVEGRAGSLTVVRPFAACTAAKRRQASS